MISLTDVTAHRRRRQGPGRQTSSKVAACPAQHATAPRPRQAGAPAGAAPAGERTRGLVLVVLVLLRLNLVLRVIVLLRVLILHELVHLIQVDWVARHACLLHTRRAAG